ncbi:MAG: SpoIIE family protein phosphatase [bacterium]|nr:SpoIIE family protein phosphatase [bacterium]
MKEIKGDRKSIGGKQNNRMFSRHEIPLDTEKTIYLTSDGFVDQNDEENRKFSSRRFKQLLEANAHLDMPAQKEALLEELKSHRGKDEQRDDITILGIRFTAIKE